MACGGGLPLSLFGLICIASATRINLGESPANVIKQGVFFLIGIALMVIAANADYEYISQFTIPLYIVNILLLVTVLLVGSESKGATRWIALGPLTIQPSEFAKVIMIFCLAKVITERQKQISDLKTIGFLCVYTGIPLLLIQKQPALSASLVLVAIFCIEIFIAGLDWRIIRNVLVVTVPIVALILFDVSREHPLFTEQNSCGASVQPYPFLCGPQPRCQPVLSDRKIHFCHRFGEISGQGSVPRHAEPVKLSAGAT